MGQRRGEPSTPAAAGSASEPVHEERRLVTGLFADLVGFTMLGDERDPEEVRAIQRSYFSAVSREVERFGGSVEKYIGDAVVAVFGVPLARDDDAERALRAALAIRDAVASLPELEVRIGVNTGEVVGGAADERGGHVLAGDAMNTAARLQQAAEPGAILVGPVTRRLTAADFEFAPATPLAVKGKSAPVEVAALAGVRERAIRVRGGNATLVGRDEELRSLQSSLGEALAGRGRVVAVIGEAGIGKSRLAVELRERAASEGADVAWAAARSYASEEPYFLVGRLVRELLGPDGSGRLPEALAAAGIRDASATARWAPVLATLLGDASNRDARVPGGQTGELTPQGRQRALTDALEALVRARSERAPLVLVLDDLHWVDAASQAVLDDLVDAVADLPVLVLATARPQLATSWSGKRHYRQVNLDSLADAAALRLAHELAGDMPEGVARRLLDRSGGNPFFLEELVATAASGDAADDRLPETVQEVVAARIDALPAASRRTLQLAAVVGMEFDVDLLAVLDPPLDVAGHLEALRREDLVVRRRTAERDLLVFRHPLIQEAAYRSLLVSHRRNLHGRLARHFEGLGRDDLLPAVAVHYRAGDDPDAARDALVRAGERAERLFATSEASRFYEDAAALTGNDPDRAELLERAGFQAYLSGAQDRAVELYRRVIDAYERAGSEVRALDARRMLGRVHWIAGDRAAAEQQTDEAIAGLERLPPSPELAAAYSYRSQLLMLLPRFEEAVAWADRAIALARQVGAEHVLPHAYTNRGAARQGMGDPGGFDDLRLALRLSLAQDRPDDAARAYTNLSAHGTLIFWLPADEMAALHDEGIAYAAEKLPGGVYEQALRQARLELLVFTGRWSEADAEIPRFRTLARYNRWMLESTRGLLAAYRGDARTALEHLLPSLAETEAVRDLQLVVPRYVALMHAHRAEGAFAEAMHDLTRLLAIIGEVRDGRHHAFLAFEGADIARFALLAGDPSTGGLVGTLARVAAEADAAMIDAPTAVDRSVREALVGAAARALADVASRLDHDARGALDAVAQRLPDETEAAGELDDARRAFDAARARLWAAERDATLATRDIAEAFDRLGAVAHAARARGIGDTARRSS